MIAIAPAPAKQIRLDAAGDFSGCMKGADPGTIAGRQRQGLLIYPVLSPVYSRFPVNRYAPRGTVISNRAPLPNVPVSAIVIPVIARIWRDRKSPKPVCLP